MSRALLVLDVDPQTRDAAERSIASLLSIWDPSAAPEELVQIVDESIDFTVVHVRPASASGAGEATVRLEPAEAYLRNVLTIAARHVELGVIRIEFCHGWPILSLVDSADPSVTEAGGASSLARGGAA